MSDIVNEFFRKHYPSDYATAWQTEYLAAGEHGRSYIGNEKRSTIFPMIVCADGFSMSVQGHFGAYSYPSDDFAERYGSVEIFHLSAPEPLFGEHCREYADGITSPMGYVPVWVVNAVIKKHGGLA